jgi:CBS-domain-containing membrane protein
LIGTGRNSVLGSLRELADDERAAATHRLAETTSVTAIMTKEVIEVAEDASLLDVAELMQAYKVKRLPVVRGGKVVGIVSRIDVLKALTSDAAPDEVRRPSTPATDAADGRLRDAIIAAMGAVPDLPIRRADVVVKGGVAHLWGVVPNDMTRRSCVALAKKVPGVKNVLDHKHVAAGRGRR